MRRRLLTLKYFYENRDDQKLKSFRWDNVFTAYILSVFFVALQFATSYNSSYNKMALMFAFLHFGFETSQSWHFTLSGKAAMHLSIGSVGICIFQALMVWVLPLETMGAVLALEFVATDSFSFLSALCLMYNKAMPPKIRVFAFSVSLHFIGVSIALYQQPIERYIVNITRQHGAHWFLIGAAALPQLWLCQDVIKGKLNYIGPVAYDKRKNSKFFILFSKYGACFVSVVVLPAISFILALYRTVESETGYKFAGWIWDDLISAVAWPASMFGILCTVYLRAVPYEGPSDIDKDQ